MVMVMVLDLVAALEGLLVTSPLIVLVLHLTVRTVLLLLRGAAHEVGCRVRRLAVVV